MAASADNSALHTYTAELVSSNYFNNTSTVGCIAAIKNCVHSQIHEFPASLLLRRRKSNEQLNSNQHLPRQTNSAKQ